jgi:hypothetical protein
MSGAWIRRAASDSQGEWRRGGQSAVEVQRGGGNGRVRVVWGMSPVTTGHRGGGSVEGTSETAGGGSTKRWAGPDGAVLRRTCAMESKGGGGGPAAGMDWLRGSRILCVSPHCHHSHHNVVECRFDRRGERSAALTDVRALPDAGLRQRRSAFVIRNSGCPT